MWHSCGTFIFEGSQRLGSLCFPACARPASLKALPPCSLLFLNKWHMQPWNREIPGRNRGAGWISILGKDSCSVGNGGCFPPLCCITEWNRKLLSLQISQRTSKQPDAFPPICWLLRSVCNGVGQFLWAEAKMVLWWSHLAKAAGSAPSPVADSLWSYLCRSKSCLLPLPWAHSCECACLACKQCWS